ncbi:hypothetical protein V8G54_024875 [Vigna mungo]|uniref:Uncharacterized protein n=1 Tax=Vigna mungo TaxID=3915 RepID=A0AAQ3RTI9_VIGMU
MSLSYNFQPFLIWELHQSLKIFISLLRIRLCLNHVTNRFIEGMYLMRFKIHNGGGKACQKLRHKRFIFTNLSDHKFPLALLHYFQKCVTSHILNSRMGLMHKLKQLIHNSFKEFPMSS